jgi:hypothetical protein
MPSYRDFAGVISVTDAEFGADPTHATDSRAAFQAAIDACFGTAADPHGNDDRFLNRTLIIPPGNYAISGPLYLTNVMSGRIIGGGQNNTRLHFTGTYDGNTVATSSGGADTITPLIMMNGFAYGEMAHFNIAIGDDNSVGIYIYQDGTEGQTTANYYHDILIEGPTAGVLIGYESNALCSEQQFKNVKATQCQYGFRNISANALNNTFDSCGASENDVGFSNVTGNISVNMASLANNGVDVQLGGSGTPFTITASRTESQNFIDASSNTEIVTVTGCIQDQATTDAGYFINLGATARGVLTGNTTVGTNSDEGIIQGSSGSHVHLIGDNDFRNTAFLGSYTGTVHTDLGLRTVTQLPTAHAKYKCTTARVSDANATTFASNVAGSGSNIVPVYCDGTNWKIG